MSKHLLACLFVVAACDQNQTGHVATTKLGDTSHLATRGSPFEELDKACAAAGLMFETDAIHRRPYLQQLTGTSAIVGWMTGTPEGQKIEISKPDGTVVATTDAEPEAGTSSAVDKQMWTNISQLEPDTIYCYRVMVNGTAVSERVGFRTAPSADSTRTIGILAFGDSGAGSSDQYALRAQMDTVPAELIIHTGDLAYDSGTLNELETTVFEVYDDLFRHLPFFPAAGNHDYKTLGGSPFRAAFNLPMNGDNEKWYSFDWGRIHFAALDTEADYKTQAAWLDADLASTSLPWKIVFMHRPPYSSGNHGSDVSLRNALAPVVERHHVQLVLAGHDHDYERITPQNGVAYVVTGGGGRGTYDVGNSGFTGFSESVIHFAYIEVGVDQLVLHAIDAQGTEFDSLVVPR